jgi:hypothetical protein
MNLPNPKIISKEDFRKELFDVKMWWFIVALFFWLVIDIPTSFDMNPFLILLIRILFWGIWVNFLIVEGIEGNWSRKNPYLYGLLISLTFIYYFLFASFLDFNPAVPRATFLMVFGFVIGRYFFPYKPPIFEPSDDEIKKMKDKKDIKELAMLLNYEHGSISRKAIEALTAIGRKAVPFLIPALYDKNRSIRLEATEVIGKIKDNRAVDFLLDVLNEYIYYGNYEDDDFESDFGTSFTVSLIKALGEIGDEKAIEPLNSLLKDGNGDIRKAAKGTLEKIETLKH